MNVVVVPLLSHVWLCDLLDCSMPGFPVLHHFPEFTQTHVHWVGDAIQLSHPLSPLLLNSIFPTLIWNVIIFVYLLDIYTHTHTHTKRNLEPGYRTSLSQRANKQTIISDSECVFQLGCHLLWGWARFISESHRTQELVLPGPQGAGSGPWISPGFSLFIIKPLSTLFF